MPVDYTIHRVIDDLCADLKRYAEAKGYDCLSFFRLLNVLISSPSFFAIVVFRMGVWKDSITLSYFKYFVGLLHYAALYLSVVLLKIQIDGDSRIGPGLMLSNKGQIIMGVESMGSKCTIGHRVTLGWGLGSEIGKKPSVGDRVKIGENSIVHGPIFIGHGVEILPFTVLSKSIPDNIRVGGNPAKLIRE